MRDFPLERKGINVITERISLFPFTNFEFNAKRHYIFNAFAGVKKMKLLLALILIANPISGTIVGKIVPLKEVLHSQPCVQDSFNLSDKISPISNPFVLVTEQGIVLHLLDVPMKVLQNLRCSRVMIIGNFYADYLTIEVKRIRIFKNNKWAKVWDVSDSLNDTLKSE